MFKLLSLECLLVFKKKIVCLTQETSATCTWARNCGRDVTQLPTNGDALFFQSIQRRQHTPVTEIHGHRNFSGRRMTNNAPSGVCIERKNTRHIISMRRWYTETTGHLRCDEQLYTIVAAAAAAADTNAEGSADAVSPLSKSDCQ